MSGMVSSPSPGAPSGIGWRPYRVPGRWTPNLPGCYPHAVRGVLLAIKADLGCLLVSLLFLIIMASTIVFATILTPPAHNPYV
jgi:hypothetical protein